MKRAILIMVAAASVAWGQHPAVEKPPQQEPQVKHVEQLTMRDFANTLRELSVELSEARLQIIALQRQTREWQARAQAAEARLKASEKPAIAPPPQEAVGEKRD